MLTRLLPVTQESIEEACKLLQNGEIVAIPTETVYGLAANAIDENAVQKIFTAKGRPQDNPLIVHVCDMNMLYTIAQTNEDCEVLAKAFWPGPLTVILPKKETIPNVTSAGLNTVGVRMPSHPAALEIMIKSGLPLAAPSANLSGKPSPTNAQDLMQDMNGRIPLILDGGECEVGVESTVVSLLEETPVILRPGYITKKQMEKVLCKPVEIAKAVSKEIEETEQVQSPGMKYKHYAPNAEIFLVHGNKEAYCEYVNSKADEGTFAFCFEEDISNIKLPYITYGESTDAKSQTKRLFTALRELDKAGAKQAFVHIERTDGVYLSIYNRLLRAAQFRVIKLKEPFIVALTGRSGSGKSLVANLIREKGIPVLDADVFAREVVDIHTCREELKQAFGEDIYVEDVLNRKLLATRAFETLEGKKLLIDITHPYIVMALLNAAKEENAKGANVVMVDGSTIIDGPFAEHCKKIVVVESKEELRIERLCKRDNLPEEEIVKRLAIQPSDDLYREKADFIIINDETEKELYPQIRNFMNFLKGWLNDEY